MDEARAIHSKPARWAIALTLFACTPAEVESSATPTEIPVRVEPNVPTATPEPVAATPEPAASPGTRQCPELIVDFDEHLAALAVPPADIATARKVLATPARDTTRSPEEEHAKALTKRLGDPLPALAHLVTDYELGDQVAFTMFAVDPDKAAPLVFASMPRSDRNVQFHSFSMFLRVVFDNKPPCWNALVRDAARRTLKAGTNADAAEQALFALGVTGTADDTMLLRGYVRGREPVDFWRDRLTDAAEAALARLGDRTAIATIRKQLDVPVAKRLDFDGAVALTTALNKAGFAHQRALAELVCRHIVDVSAMPDGHRLAPRPAQHAAMALGHIVDDRPLDDPAADAEIWAERCRTRAF